MHEMSRGGPCGRPDGHVGHHLSLAAYDRDLEYKRLWRGRNREYHHKYNRGYEHGGRRAEMFSRQLERGEQIKNRTNHHKGMAALKTKLGDPRPEGMTLSLVNPESPSSYWGYSHRRRQRCPYRLSTDPVDYAWESQGENNARRSSVRAATAEVAK